MASLWSTMTEGLQAVIAGNSRHVNVSAGVTAGVLAYIVWERQHRQKVDPAGKAVFITGCDSGFGNILARRMHERGFQVFAGCAKADGEGARLLRSSSYNMITVVQLDVADEAQVYAAIATVRENLGNNVLWALVNNAGKAALAEVEWCPIREFQSLLAVNCLGVVAVTRAALPLLRQSGGRVINLSSVAGRYPLPGFGAYSMSKSAVLAFSETLRMEMRKFNIKVITVEPALLRSPLMERTMVYTKNLWEAADPGVRATYGDAYFHAFLQDVSGNLAQRTHIDEVVSVAETAVTVSAPKERYVPNWRTRNLDRLLQLLPSALARRLLLHRFPQTEMASKFLHRLSPANELRSQASDASSTTLAD